MAVEPQLMTADQLLRLPRNGQRHELVNGELRTMPPAGFEHGDLTVVSAVALATFVRAHNLGRVVAGEPGFLLTRNPDTVRAPDVGFVSRERLVGVGRVRGYWPGAPDLAIEVISPNDLYTEVEEKIATWLAHGTRLVFVVNPRQQSVTVYRPGQPARRLGPDDILDGEDVVPGWKLPLRELFSEV